MSQAAPHLTSSVSEQLGLVEHQHQVLLSALKITQSIEQLQNGLQATLLLGQPSAQINAKAMQTFAELSEKTKRMSNQRLKLAVQQLDEQIAQKISVILTIAKSDDFANMENLFNGDVDSEVINQTLDNVLQEFRKKAQTAVALRVLLQERGIASEPLRHNVVEADITQELEVLEQKEQRCRQQVKREITVLKRDLTSLLSRSDISAQTRAAAEHIHQDLQRDLEHIQAGKPFSDLPSAVEVIELCAEPEILPVNAMPNQEGAAHAEQVNANKPRLPLCDASDTLDEGKLNSLQGKRSLPAKEKPIEMPAGGWFAKLYRLLFARH